MNRAEQLPKFICIGAQRAGTTWLHFCLQEHPEIFMPATKELHFFDMNYDKGFDWYQEHFSNRKEQHKTWGEVTPDYYHREYALERIKDAIPDVKIIYIMRNPIDRAYSQYQLFNKKKEGVKSFFETIQEDKGMKHLSCQGAHLETTQKIFGHKNVMPLFYDELSANPTTFIKKVYAFIGVDSSFQPSSLNTRVNRVVFPKAQKLLQTLKLSFVIEIVKRSFFAELIKNLAKPKNKRVLSRQQKEEIIKYFSDDISLIEQLTTSELKHWR